MPAYELPPIDYWTGATYFDPDEEAAIAAGSPPPGIFPSDDDPHGRATELTELHQRAVVVFDELGWEGDGNWRCGAVPNETSTQLWIGVKQQNNGTTYVLSPVEMPWLNGHAFRVIP
jgi:hypothetical protein